MLDKFGDAADVGGDNGDFAGHGFEGGKAEGFELRGKQEKIGGSQLFVNGVLFAEEENVFLEAAFADEVFGRTAVRAVTHEDELGRHFGANEGKGFHGVGEPPNGAATGREHADGCALRGPLYGESFVGSAIVTTT